MTLWRVLIVLGCLYEIVAIMTGLVPTITAISKRYPVAGVALLLLGVWHFFIQPTVT